MGGKDFGWRFVSEAFAWLRIQLMGQLHKLLLADK
jgi:hypothetical protein